MKSTANVTTVIIAYSWSGRKHPFFKDFPTIVIENNAQAHHPSRDDVELITNQVNTGFAKAINQGALHADTEYILFVNDDCLITSEQIEQLVESSRRNGWDAISPTLVDQAGHVQLQYQQSLPSFLSIFQEWTPLHRLGVWRSKQKTLPGACLLVKKSVLEKLMGWDERFWLWWEDSDFSYRLHKHDVPFGIDTEIRVTHVGGESFAPLETAWKKQVFFHSLRIFAHKHFSTWQAKLLQAATRRFDGHTLYPVDPEVRASIVVPNVRKHLLEDFLAKHAKSWNWSADELIVVTSAKGIEALLQKYPQVVWIQLAENKGFADTVNIGLRRARGQWLGTVNDDTVLPDGWINSLLAKYPARTGSLSPIVVDKSSNIESAGVDYHVRGKAEPIKTVPSSITETDTCNAAAVLFAHDALEEVGLFDERFGSYLEDVDLGLRLQKKGWKNVVIPEVRITHFGQQTSSSQPLKTAWQNVRNWWLVVTKNTPLSEWFTSGPAILLERGRNVSGFFKALSKKDS